MSILPGSEGRRDPERADALRRQRVRFARDIGDEHGQAWAHEPRRGPGRFTVGTFVVLVLFAAAGAIPLLLNRGDGGLVRPNCDEVVLGVGPGTVATGASFGWQVAGPESGQYVVALDADTVSVDASGRAVAAAGTVLGGPTALPGCRSMQTVSTAPTTPGEHSVTVFRRTDDGWRRVTVASLNVR